MEHGKGVCIHKGLKNLEFDYYEDVLRREIIL